MVGLGPPWLAMAGHDQPWLAGGMCARKRIFWLVASAELHRPGALAQGGTRADPGWIREGLGGGSGADPGRIQADPGFLVTFDGPTCHTRFSTPFPRRIPVLDFLETHLYLRI